MTIPVRCEWRRYPDGFAVVKREPKPDDDEDPRFEPGLWLTPRKPKRWETYVLEGIGNRLCLELANMPITKEGIVDFANRWGTFGILWGTKASDDEQMAVIAGVVSAFRHTIEQVVDAGGEPGPDFEDWVQLKLRRGKLAGDTVSRNFLEVSGLYAFCYAEFLELLESRVEFRRCPRCGKLLARGKVGKPQIYCSDACLMAMYYRRRKKKAAEAAKEDGSENVVNLMGALVEKVQEQEAKLKDEYAKQVRKVSASGREVERTSVGKGRHREGSTTLNTDSKRRRDVARLKRAT